MYTISLSEDALDDIAQLDKKSQKIIFDKLVEIEKSPNPMTLAKTLTCPYKNIFRFRVGAYRLVFEKKDEELLLLIILVEQRKNIYQNINRKLKKRL